MEHEEEIKSAAQIVAETLRDSLNAYWPADATAKNDPCEANLTIHFANAFLNKGFAVFAEVHHSFLKSTEGDRKIDLLAVSSDRHWFVAGEFKKHSPRSMAKSGHDITRLSTFTLNADLDTDKWSAERRKVVNSCNQGIGLVAGLSWYSGRAGSGSLSARTAQEKLGRRITASGGAVAAPLLVRRAVVGRSKGAYFLQYAYFSIGEAGRENLPG